MFLFNAHFLYCWKSRNVHNWITSFFLMFESYLKFLFAYSEQFFTRKRRDYRFYHSDFSSMNVTKWQRKHYQRDDHPKKNHYNFFYYKCICIFSIVIEPRVYKSLTDHSLFARIPSDVVKWLTRPHAAKIIQIKISICRYAYENI